MLVDDRVGSVDLLGPLQRFGVPAESMHLDFGDFAFVGRGLGDAELLIGIELKATQDLIGSLRSDRFVGHQLPGLVSTYHRPWLVTEGIWRASPDGVLQVAARGSWATVYHARTAIMAADLESWLLTQIIRGGLHYWHCATRADTIRFLASLYHWWTDKSLEEHRSHQAIYRPPPDRAFFSKPTTERAMLACIPSVGWDKSALLEEAFGGVRGVLNASPVDLLRVPGIGPVIAKTIAGIL